MLPCSHTFLNPPCPIQNRPVAVLCAAQHSPTVSANSLASQPHNSAVRYRWAASVAHLSGVRHLSVLCPVLDHRYLRGNRATLRICGRVCARAGARPIFVVRTVRSALAPSIICLALPSRSRYFIVHIHNVGSRPCPRASRTSGLRAPLRTSFRLAWQG